MKNQYLWYGALAIGAYWLWQRSKQQQAATPTPTQSFFSYLTQYGSLGW